MLGLNQTLTGDFGNDQVAVETRAHADSVTVEFAGIPYLNQVRLDLTVDAAADLAKKTFALQEGSGRPPQRAAARRLRHGRLGR